jgi:hypothetical protein
MRSALSIERVTWLRDHVLRQRVVGEGKGREQQDDIESLTKAKHFTHVFLNLPLSPETFFIHPLL